MSEENLTIKHIHKIFSRLAARYQFAWRSNVSAGLDKIWLDDLKNFTRSEVYEACKSLINLKEFEKYPFNSMQLRNECQKNKRNEDFNMASKNTFEKTPEYLEEGRKKLQIIREILSGKCHEDSYRSSRAASPN